MSDEPAPYAATNDVPVSTTPTLFDPWEPGRSIPLDRGLERQRFAPILMAFMVLIIGFVLFQLIIGPVATVVLLWQEGVTIAEILSDPLGVVSEHTRAMLLANTVGQVLGLALPILVLLGFHSSQKWAFIRFRAPDWSLVGLSIVGLAGLTPIAWWLGSLNAEIPLPEWMQAIEKPQNELIEMVFTKNLGLAFSLAVMALTPAFCEEILFRGYIQRQLERSMGVFWAIVLTGFIFGMYHVRPSQIIPLSFIGIYMAYITWRSGSLWLAIIIHFLNNAFAVGLGIYLNQRTDIDLETLEQMDVPLLILLSGFLVCGGALYLMHYLAVLRSVGVPDPEVWESGSPGVRES